MKKMFAGLALAAGLLAMTGCQGAFNESDIVRSNAPNLKVEITDKDLADSLHIFQTGVVKSEGGYTGYLTRGRLKRGSFFSWVFCSYRRILVEYRYAWYRADGQEICTPQTVSWKQLHLFDGQEFSASDMAPVAGIDRATIYIRPVQTPEMKKKAEAEIRKDAAKGKKSKQAASAEAAKKAEVSPVCIPADTTHVDSVSGSEKISAGQLKQQVKELRQSISKQIQVDEKDPGVSITEKDIQKAAGTTAGSEQLHGKNEKNVSGVAVSIMKDSQDASARKKAETPAAAPAPAAKPAPAAAPAPAAKPAPAAAPAPAAKAKGTCRCGCLENPGFKCYCSAGSDCPAAKAKKK